MTENQKNTNLYREWAIICDNISNGNITILIRKGGIAEGNHGFSFKHSHFYLLKSYYHAQKKSLKENHQNDYLPQIEKNNPEITVDTHCEITKNLFINDWNKIKNINKFHIYNQTYLHERFHSDQNPKYHGLHISIIRASKLKYKLKVGTKNNFKGCKSWFKQNENYQKNLKLEKKYIIKNEKFTQLKKSISNILQ